MTGPEQEGAAPSDIHAYQWRQTITFQECVHDPSRPGLPSTQQLSVDSVFVLYNREEKILRYALSNSIGPVRGRSGSPDLTSLPSVWGGAGYSRPRPALTGHSSALMLGHERSVCSGSEAPGKAGAGPARSLRTPGQWQRVTGSKVRSGVLWAACGELAFREHAVCVSQLTSPKSPSPGYMLGVRH